MIFYLCFFQAELTQRNEIDVDMREVDSLKQRKSALKSKCDTLEEQVRKKIFFYKERLHQNE